MIKKAKRSAMKCFVGIGKFSFNRKSLLAKTATKRTPKITNPAADLAIVKVGLPGSKERIEAYALCVEKNEELFHSF